MIKNWFGMESHATDYLIHWTCKNPEVTAKELRLAYDSIVDAGLEDDLQLLLDAAYDSGRDDENDSNNPDL